MILDTNAVSALFAGDPELDRVLAGSERHHLPSIVIGEYRYGLLRSARRTHLLVLLESLVRESYILCVDEQTAEPYAEVREHLRQEGRPIPENDVWISALSIQHGEPVVTRDHHFDQVQGVERIGW